MEGEMVRKIFIRIHTEIGIKVAFNKIEDIWPKSGQYLKKHKYKWERIVKNIDGDDERKRDDEREN